MKLHYSILFLFSFCFLSIFITEFRGIQAPRNQSFSLLSNLCSFIERESTTGWLSGCGFVGSIIEFTKDFSQSESECDFTVKVKPYACLIHNAVYTIARGRISQDSKYPQLFWLTFTPKGRIDKDFYHTWLIYASNYDYENYSQLWGVNSEDYSNFIKCLSSCLKNTPSDDKYRYTSDSYVHFGHSFVTFRLASRFHSEHGLASMPIEVAKYIIDKEN